MEFTPVEITLLLATFLVGGFVKGVSGIGMPLFVVPILLQFVSLQSALAIMIVPVALSNVMQLTCWPEVRAAARRFRVMLAVIPAGICLGSLALLHLDPRRLDILIGVVIGVFAVVGLVRISPAATVPDERFWNPVVGLVTGVLGGFSSFYGPPIAFYLISLRIPRESFITTSALIFAVAGASLNLVLIGNGLVGWHDLALSLVSVGPVFAGLHVGNRARRRLPQKVFDRMILVSLVVIALNQIRRGVGW